MVDLIPPLVLVRMKPLEQFIARNAVTIVVPYGDQQILTRLGRAKDSTLRQAKNKHARTESDRLIAAAAS